MLPLLWASRYLKFQSNVIYFFMKGLESICESCRVHKSLRQNMLLSNLLNRFCWLQVLRFFAILVAISKNWLFIGILLIGSRKKFQKKYKKHIFCLRSSKYFSTNVGTILNDCTETLISTSFDLLIHLSPLFSVVFLSVCFPWARPTTNDYSWPYIRSACIQQQWPCDHSSCHFNISSWYKPYHRCSASLKVFRPITAHVRKWPFYCSIVQINWLDVDDFLWDFSWKNSSSSSLFKETWFVIIKPLPTNLKGIFMKSQKTWQIFNFLMSLHNALSWNCHKIVL